MSISGWIDQKNVVKCDIYTHTYIHTHTHTHTHTHIYTHSHTLCCAWLLSHVRLCNLMDCSPPGSSVHGDSPGKNTGVGCHAFLQGIFPIQGFNPGLPHCKWILYHLSHQGSPRTLEWVAYPFSRASSRPRNQTWVSCITGEFFTNWATQWTHTHTHTHTGIVFSLKKRRKSCHLQQHGWS